MATTIDLLQQWCEEAHKLLQSSGTKKGKAALAFQKALASVSKTMRELQALGPGLPVVASLEGEFEGIATKANFLTMLPRPKGETTDDLRKEAKKLTIELGTLSSKLTLAKTQVETLVRKRGEYLGKMETCRKTKADLETFPYADVTDVANVINGAVIGGEALDSDDILTRALTELKGFDRAVALAREKQKKGAKDAQVNIEAERACLERKRSVMALLAQAKQVAGGAGHVDALQLALNEAESSMQSKRWAEALTRLNARTVPTERSLKESQQNALSSLPQAWLKQCTDDLLLHKGLMDVASHAALEGHANTVLREATATPAKAEGLLVSLSNKLREAVLAAQGMLTQGQGFVRVVGSTLEQTKQRLPAETQVVLNDEFERLKAEMTQRRLKEAVALGEKLQRQAALAQVEANKQWAAWNLAAQTIAATVETLRSHQTAEGGTPESRAASARLVQRAVLEQGGLLTSRDWSGLLALNRELLQGVSAFDDAARQYKAFATARKTANEAFGLAVNAMQTTIDQTMQALRVEGSVDVGAAVGPFAERLRGLQTRWQQRMANATSDETLAAKAMLDEVQLLKDDVAAAGTPNGVQGAAAAQATEKARLAFESEAGAMPALLLKLEHLEPLAGQGFADRLAALRADGTKSWAERLPLLKAVIAAAGLKVVEREKERPQQNSAMKLRCEQLTQRLAVERGKLKSSGDKTFLPLFNSLTEELADLATLAGTPNSEVAKANQKLLDDVERRIRSMEAISASGSTFKPVREALERLDNDLETQGSELKENVPRSLASLTRLLLQLKGDVLSMAPQDALNEISAARLALNRALTEAGGVKRERKAFVDLVPLVTDKLNLLAADGTVSAYVDALRKRLKAAQALVKDPTKLNLGKKQLDEMHREVEAAVLNPQAGLDKQKALLDAAETGRLLALQCKSTLADIKKNGIPQAAKEVDDKGGDTALITELKRMVEAVNDIMDGDAPDHAEAMRRLRLIDARIAEIKADPYGPGIGSRKALPNDAKLFSDAATALGNELRGFKGLVATAVPTLSTAVTTKLAQMLDDLAGRINAGQFTPLALQLSDAKQAVRTRREVRERALERVRAASAMLNEHPQFMELWKNPIHVELKAQAKALNQRLMRLEANIRRAVH